MEQRVPEGRLWLVRRVLSADGTGISMPDSPLNQKLFPQPAGQKEGCGFPVVKLVAFCNDVRDLLTCACKAHKRLVQPAAHQQCRRARAAAFRKMSGGLRSVAGAKELVTMASILLSVKVQKGDPLAFLQNLVVNNLATAPLHLPRHLIGRRLMGADKTAYA